MPKLLLRFTTWPLEHCCYYFGTCFRTFWSSGVTPGSDYSESLTDSILFFSSNFATVKECNGTLKLLLHFETWPLRHCYYCGSLASSRLCKECNCRGQCQVLNKNRLIHLHGAALFAHPNSASLLLPQAKQTQVCTSN